LLKNYIIYLILGIAGTFFILYYGENIPNLLLIIQLWSILTAYIIISIQYGRVKKIAQKNVNRTITLIEDLLYFMNENYDNLLQKQEESKEKMRILRDMYKDNLNSLNCFFTSNRTEFFIVTEQKTYYINPVDIRMKEKGESINITTDRKEIECLIKNLRDFSN